MIRTSCISLASAALACLALLQAPSEVSAAETRAPEGPIEIVVPSGAGGSVDILMRRVAEILKDEKIVENPIAIVNRPGGSWAVGTNYVISRPGNENLLVATSGAQVAGPLRKDGSNVFDQTTPIANFISADLILAVRPDHPAKNLQELVESAKREPRSLKMGGANVGSTDWMGVQIFADAAGIEVNYIAYEGGAATTAAFLGGNVDAVLLNPDDGLPLAKDGKAKLFAVLSEERRTEPDLKDIPTAKEQGIDAVMVQAFGVSGPPELDPAVVAWWAEKLDQAHETEGWKKMLADNYYGDGYVSGPEAKKFMDDFFNMYKAAFIKFGVIKDPS